MHSIADLPSAAREAIASVTGLALGADQQFYVVIVNPHDEQREAAALAIIKGTAATAARNAAASGADWPAVEANIDEVAEDVRRGGPR